MINDYLYLARETVFLTCEGEGRLIGYPSVFMRLSMCNLTCAGFKSADSPYGCDSFVSWSVKNKMTFDEIFSLLEKENYISNLRDGAVFKITGGEPLLQQKSLIEFIKRFAERYSFLPRIDFETNGTLLPDPGWNDTIEATFTVSPKLSNNGDPESSRFKPEVLRYHVTIGSCFKFVVKSETDWNEIESKYINNDQINLPKGLIWLMPCCGSRDEQTRVSADIVEICKKHSVRFSPRLHLMIWDKALGV